MNGFYNSVKEWLDAGMPVNSFICGDCMQGMAAMPDKFAGLALPDPPYGIDIANKLSKINDKYSWQNHEKKDWDKKRPPREYFSRLLKISENQIIFGGNYFADFLHASRCWLAWDKAEDFSTGDFELAWTSFDKPCRIFRFSKLKEWHYPDKVGLKIHPTQKPVALYRWLLHNYATPGQIILDTHVGSASSLIACEQMNFPYVGFEIDPDYHAAACKRILQARELLRQNELFDRNECNGKVIQNELSL